MAKAGYCSACGQNVYLNETGACPNGHGPECVSGVYDVPAASPAPKKRRTGLVITLVVVGLLLLCGCSAVAGLLIFRASGPGSTPTSKPNSAKPSAADEKARVETAFSFLKAMGTGDQALFKSVMPAETVKTVPAESWDALLADAAADPTTFESPSWSGSAMTVAWSDSDGTKGTMEFRTVGADQVLATLKPEASESEDATVTVKSESGRWTVVKFETIDGPLEFDAESIKALVE